MSDYASRQGESIPAPTPWIVPFNSRPTDPIRFEETGPLDSDSRLRELIEDPTTLVVEDYIFGYGEVPFDRGDQILDEWWSDLSPIEKQVAWIAAEFCDGLPWSDVPIDHIDLDQFDDHGFVIPLLAQKEGI